MGWLFGKQKKGPEQAGRPFDEKELRFPMGSSPPKRVIEAADIKAAAGLERPLFEEMSEPVPQPSFKGSKNKELGQESLPSIPHSNGPLYVKMDVYQRILGELEDLKVKTNHVYEAQKKLESSEYNEEKHFTILRRAMKNLHDRLLQVDKVLFK